MTTSKPICRGLGISAGIEAGLARDLAVNCERLGYHALVERRADRSWPGDARAVRRRRATARTGRGGSSSRPTSASCDRGGDRPSRAGSGEALGRRRVWPTARAARHRAAGRRRVTGTPSGPNAHRSCSHATATVPHWWSDRRRCAAQLDAACPSGGGASMGAGRSGPGGPVRPHRIVPASPWDPTRSNDSATRRAITATSTRPIAGTSRPWMSRSAASVWPHRHGPNCSKAWHRTTLRSIFRSFGCSQKRARSLLSAAIAGAPDRPPDVYPGAGNLTPLVRRKPARQRAETGD